MSLERVLFFSDLEAFSIGNVIAEAEATELGGLWGRRVPEQTDLLKPEEAFLNSRVRVRE